MLIKLSWEIKYNYVMRFINGESPTKLGLEINPSYKNPGQIIMNWKYKYTKLGIRAFEKEIKSEFLKNEKDIDLSKFSKEELEEVIRIYRNLLKIKNKREAFSAIKNYYGILSVRKLCYLLGVNRSSYYWWLKNQSSDKYNLIWLNNIEILFFKYNQIFGVRRIKVYLEREYQININLNTVHRYMKFLGLKALIRTSKIKKINQKTAKTGWPNLIKRDFNASVPHQKLFTDVSYIKLGYGHVYLSIVIDSFNNEIIDYKISKFNDSCLIKANLEAAFKNIKTRPILHSDHGIHYISRMYKNMIKKELFKPSMSRLANSLDNRPAEYFFSVLKEEKLKFFNYQSSNFKNLKQAISDFIRFYNHERIQSCLENLPPIEYKNKYQTDTI